ncbi:WD40-repeat-containing domain protein [Hysterangium stoloniferum]|nr:WD40-repeat-containing domain protein [Hysterangium stoloniferum]
MQTSDVSNFFRTETELAKDEARKEKAQRTKNLGSPLDLPGKILSLKIRGSEAWTAESGHVARRLSLETGKTLQIYRGHTGPVTCIAFREPDVLFTGSWDNTIKAWNISDNALLSTTQSHTDFVKVLLLVPTLSLLVSGSSDKVVRLWDASDVAKPLTQLGSISSHARPVEVLAFEPINETSGMLYTADTMGVIKVWEVQREYGPTPTCRTTLRSELQDHRTGINDVWVGNGFVWSASSDESLIIQPLPRLSTVANTKRIRHKITHPQSINAILPLSLTNLSEPYIVTASGEVVRVYAFDPHAPEDKPELVGEIDAHWHDVTDLGLWMRVVEKGGKKRIETWILSASLDATLRRWQLEELLNPSQDKGLVPAIIQLIEPSTSSSLTEEEEHELEELLADD